MTEKYKELKDQTKESDEFDIMEIPEDTKGEKIIKFCSYFRYVIHLGTYVCASVILIFAIFMYERLIRERSFVHTIIVVAVYFSIKALEFILHVIFVFTFHTIERKFKSE